MKKSPLQRKTPMTRAKPLSGILRTANLPVKVVSGKQLKSGRPKMTPIRRSAKGEECTMRIIGVCNQNPETTVWCHSNQYEDGKGMGIKARDEEGCYGCSACHEFYDGGYVRYGVPRSVAQAFFDLARKASREILKRNGLIL